MVALRRRTASDVASVSERKRCAFLGARVQQLEAYLVWSHDPGLRSAAGRFRAMVDARRALVAEHTPVEMLGAVEASRLLSELAETERLDGDVRRLFAAHAAKVIREGYGQLPVWFSRLPAQPPGRQVRSAGLAACLAPVFGPPRGSVRSGHLGRESLAVFETPWRTPYHYDLFAGDVGHTLILGATGSGKSFALNFLLVEALKYGPRVLILDLGGSYRWLTRFLGGRYLELTPGEAEPGLRLQPFALPAGARTFQFLARIEDLYALGPESRTRSMLAGSLPAAMWPALSRWMGDGAWGAYFDNAPVGASDLEFRDWHSLRRKFASDLMNQPLKVLCELGGWKTARTVLQCYQRADEDQLRKALEARRRACSQPN